MTKHLQKQLNHQRQRLQLELPPSTSSILNKLLKRDVDSNYELNNLELQNGHAEIGALPTPASEMAARVAVKQNHKLKTKRHPLTHKIIMNYIFIIWNFP